MHDEIIKLRTGNYILLFVHESVVEVEADVAGVGEDVLLCSTTLLTAASMSTAQPVLVPYVEAVLQRELAAAAAAAIESAWTWTSSTRNGMPSRRDMMQRFFLKGHCNYSYVLLRT
jgi:hypothetical protein